MARFVLDESSWAGAAAHRSTAVLSDAIERLLARLDVARERGEGVAKHGDYYRTDLGDGVQLFSVLFESDCRVQLDHDLAFRLVLALDRADELDDSGLVDYDVVFDGEVRFAPGVSWAHACCREGHEVAVLPLALGEGSVGRVAVTVADDTLEICFVAGESGHVEFFRSVIGLESADEEQFAGLAGSAFPALDWADGVWRGLRQFSRPYIAVRDELVRCLGGLSDYGAACFEEYGAGDPRELAGVLSAKVGAGVSDEDGRTKRNADARRDRTRHHRGVEKVFWWHVKLQPNVDRIHFLYEPGSGGHGHRGIVVGLFKDHCMLLD